MLEHYEQCRNKKQQGERSEYHATYHSGSERAATVCAHPVSHHQRHKTYYHRQYGHQYRTETGFGGAIGGFRQRHSFLTPFAGKLGDEDCRFRKQTDNHDKSCLHIDVVLQIEEICKKRNCPTDRTVRKAVRQTE